MPLIADLLYSLRYQVLSPRITTIGPCATEGCSHLARGSGTCEWCLASKLSGLTGDAETINQLVQCLREAQCRLMEYEEHAETLIKG